MNREIEYWVIVEMEHDMDIIRKYSYREAMAERKRIKQEHPEHIVRIEMR